MHSNTLRVRQIRSFDGIGRSVDLFELQSGQRRAVIVHRELEGVRNGHVTPSFVTPLRAAAYQMHFSEINSCLANVCDSSDRRIGDT